MKHILLHKIAQCKDPEWNEHYHVLADVRNLEIDYREKDISAHLDISMDIMKLSSKRKSAAITINPKQVVFGTLVKRNSSENVAINMEFFSTIKAAGSWLGYLPEQYGIIKNTLQSISNE